MSSQPTYQHHHQRQRIIVAGGGTGGHIFPAIAIANAIKKIHPDTEFLFVGAKGKMEMEKIPQAGFNIEGLDIAGFNRSSLLKNISLPYKLVKSFFQVGAIFKKFKPTAVIGVGGYSSFPVLRYAQSKNIPTFLHESNSFAGKSNIMLGKKATKIFTATDGMQQFFPNDKIVITGNPVRQTISNSVVQKNEAVQFFNLSVNKKTILVVGGSLGAKSINECIAQNIALFQQQQWQLIWQTGKPFYQQAKEVVKGFDNIYMSDFIAQMEYAYAAADVVVSRSGAMAVAELCLVKKPVVFVPYPFAAEDHQTANAMALVNKKAALLVNDKDVMALLMNTLTALVNNEQHQQQLIANISTLAINNADEIIANQILAAI
ncbi:undecaprenyldiphospho-muramoylpentapeptide beta-N-acetylglucosaminyltransferase [Ferruginibacter yonginensis]|uniref:UDP-N-acetylglucosamine--N-acetylmuramyl-(pentapeptide) pyrophosphoryl-undecaprenol N-acetylglucosamine transferase n=1 Tax=Ferruginibacter yonginensis TaxID=1310416 RepID=A0ABV8QTC0_9BACT